MLASLRPLTPRRQGSQLGRLCDRWVAGTLTTLAQLLRDNTRTGDVLARQGGEEFVMVLPDMAPERAAEVCERLRERVAAHVWGPGIVVTISIGLAAAPVYELQALMQRADQALYSAKRGGRNRLCRA